MEAKTTRQQRRHAEQKPDVPVRTVEVPIPNTDATATMKRFNTRDYLRLRRGDLDDLATIDMTLGAIVDFPGDPLDLPVEDLLALTERWVAAVTEVVVPPPTA